MKIIAPLSLCIVFLLASCASTNRDIIQTGHPFGMLEPGIDHVVDITMGSERVTGEASGSVILWVYAIGATDYSDGLAVTAPASSGDSIAGMFSGMFSSVTGAVGSLLPQSPLGRIKSAAVRAACDEAGCDVLGYPMFYVDETNYFLWKEIRVVVKGFPGEIKSIKNVPRKYEVVDSYWRDSPEGEVKMDLEVSGGK